MKIQFPHIKLSSAVRLTLLALVLSVTGQVAQAASGKIVFDSQRDGSDQIYIMNSDGSNQTRLTNSGTNRRPSLSADGRKIAFSSLTSSDNIYTMNVDGSNVTQLTANSADNGDPSWSPNGTKITFTSRRDSGNFEIYIMNADGSNQTRLTIDNGVDEYPAFSPDGSKIAFNSSRAGQFSQIYIMNADGSNQTRLTNIAATDLLPTFSPNGQKLVFESNRSGKSDIWVMNVDGTNPTQLTSNAADNHRPVFSPDGSQIAFDTTRDGNEEIYAMNADGSNPTRLTTNPASDVTPFWGSAFSVTTGTPKPTPIVVPTPAPTPGPPYVGYAGLTDGEALSTLPSVSGIASGGSQRVVSSVTLSIRRNTDFFYWNGGTWVNFPVQLSTILSGNPAGVVTWVRRSGLPSGSNLINASYTLSATVSNNAGVTDTNSINVALGVPDHTPPVVKINTPTALTPYNIFPIIKGVANDRPRGTGLSRIVVTIQRNSDGLYWDGSVFSFSRAFLPTTTSPKPMPGSSETVNWTCNDVPPSNVLRDGTYQIIARAYDIAGNYAGSTIFIYIDQQAPTIAFTTPLNGATVNGLSLIRGTMQDNVGGSGIKQVRLSIRRDIDGKYWNGTTFTTGLTNLPAILSGKIFAYRGSFPKSQLTQSTYTLTATAYDKAGNQAVTATTVAIDRTPPADVNFTLPTTSTKGGVVAVRSLPLISVLASDDSFGSGISRIDLTLQRASDHAYYNGTGFGGSPTILKTTLSGGLYNYAPQFAAGTLRDGIYLLSATAYDDAGNRAAPTTMTVIVDTTAPQQVTFTTPMADATVSSLSPISGTATDNATGSGIKTVQLYIQRRSDGLYWTGTTWGDSTALSTKLSKAANTTVTWTRNSGLPTDSKLTDGTYLLTALATDLTGNVKRAAISVTVNTLVPFSLARPASSVTLSKKAAQVATSSIQLSFTGALAADSALDIEHYQVEVNHHAVAVQSLAYGASAHTITVGLGENVLSPGDVLTVTWNNILDTQSRVVKGQATLTAR